MMNVMGVKKQLELKLHKDYCCQSNFINFNFKPWNRNGNCLLTMRRCRVSSSSNVHNMSLLSSRAVS
jgi:hypothetical protein